MKIAGKTLGKKSTKVITFERPDGNISLTIQALPLGFLEGTCLERIPLPVAPRNYALKNGKVLRDEAGRPVLAEAVEDPTFRTATRKVAVLQGVAFIHEGLKADPSVTWETVLNGNWETFYKGIYEEMIASGMTSGEMLQLSEEITSLSTSKQVDMEAARESFLHEELGQASAGKFQSTQVAPSGT